MTQKKLGSIDYSRPVSSKSITHTPETSYGVDAVIGKQLPVSGDQAGTYVCDCCHTTNSVWAKECTTCHTVPVDVIDVKDTSLVKSSNNFSEIERNWINRLCVKEKNYEIGSNEEDIVGCEVTRKSIVEEMKKRFFNESVYRSYQLCYVRSISFDCPNCHEVKFIPAGCHNRICPVCEESRERRLFAVYWKRIKKMKNPKLLTLTIGHIPISYEGVLSHFKKDLESFILILKEIYGKNIVSGFPITEITRTFHLHYHIILDVSEKIPQEYVSQLWHDLTGRYIVHITNLLYRQKRKLKTSSACYTAMKYVTKYVAKTPVFTSAVDYVSYLILIRGYRLLSSFGSLYGNKGKSSKKITCSECGTPLQYCETSVIIHEFMLKFYGGIQYVP